MTRSSQRALRAAASCLSLCIFCGVAHAGDAARFDLLGFSVSGDVVAFEQYGVIDGGPTPYAEIFFVSVADNQFAAPPTRVYAKEGMDETLSTVRARAMLDAQASLSEFGIGYERRGQRLVHHPATDLGIDTHRVRFAAHTPVYGLPVPPAYELVLTELPLATPAQCKFFDGIKLLHLELIDNDIRRSLQRDDALPKSRFCPFGYAIEDVWLYRSRAMLVVLRMRTPGFEGESLRYLVVTTRLTEAESQ